MTKEIQSSGLYNLDTLSCYMYIIVPTDVFVINPERDIENISFLFDVVSLTGYINYYWPDKYPSQSFLLAA